MRRNSARAVIALLFVGPLLSACLERGQTTITGTLAVDDDVYCRANGTVAQGSNEYTACRKDRDVQRNAARNPLLISSDSPKIPSSTSATHARSICSTSGRGIGVLPDANAISVASRTKLSRSRWRTSKSSVCHVLIRTFRVANRSSSDEPPI